ncbi:MAG: hypothetical protein HY855_15730 [Burkholderiales bacterium]|nr:hypothetical protein [Burkholderiales bacterium]
MTTATQPAKQPNITARLWALFDQVGLEALPLNFAQALAEAKGLNRTSAGIAFYRWRAARLVPVEQQAA